MPRRIMKGAVILAIAMLALVPATALSAEGPAQRDPDHGLIQTKNLTATRSVKTWYSEPIRGTVFVQVRTPGGVTLTQDSATNCSGTYAAIGVVVRVDLVGCGKKQANPIRVRYVTFTARRTVQVFITRHRA